jgi:hypothetical protein
MFQKLTGNIGTRFRVGLNGVELQLVNANESLSGLALKTKDGTSVPLAIEAGASSGQALVWGQNASLSSLAITGTEYGATSVVPKSYIDELAITGGHLKEMLLHEGQVADDTKGILAAVALAAGSFGETDKLYIQWNSETAEEFALNGKTLQQLTDDINNVSTGSDLVTAYVTSDLDELASSLLVLVSKDTIGANTLRIQASAAGNFTMYAWRSGATIATEYATPLQNGVAIPTSYASVFGMETAHTSMETGEFHYVRNNDVYYGWDGDKTSGAGGWQTMSGPLSIPTATDSDNGGVLGKVSANNASGLSITTGVLAVVPQANYGLTLNQGSGTGLGVLVNGSSAMAVDANGIGVMAQALGAIAYGTNSALKVNLEASTPSLEINASNELKLKYLAEGLTVGATGLALVASDGIAVGTAGISAVAGTAITVDSNGINVTAGTAISVDNDDVSVVAGTGITVANDAVEAVGNAAKAIEVTGSGIGIVLDNTPSTLSASATGLKVTGLPTQFYLGGTAVGTYVTAGNLDTLVNGGDATTLHTHSTVDGIQTIELTVKTTEGTTTSTATVPTGAVFIDIVTKVIMPYNGTNPALSVDGSHFGLFGDLQTTSENNLTVTGMYQTTPYEKTTTAGPLQVILATNGSTGMAKVYAHYVVPQS